MAEKVFSGSVYYFFPLLSLDVSTMAWAVIKGG